MTERQVVSVRNPNDGEPLDVAMENAATESSQLQMLTALNAMQPIEYDQILFEYQGDDLTRAEYRLKDQAVRTIEMTYRDHKLMSVFKS